MNDVLALWERAAAAPPAAREDALLGAAAPGSLSARNAAMLALRARLFGATQRLVATCPACAAQLEFEIDCDALSRSLLPSPDAVGVHELRCGGYRIAYRVPEISDWRAAAKSDDFAMTLLRRSVVQCELDGIAHTVDGLPDEVTNALSDALEALEPGTHVEFELRCVDCGAPWNAPMDCAAVLYGEVRARAEALLVEVDALARAYGWSEAQVLALSPTRRSAYLQLVGAD
ncbi:hypothetical protein [Caballeronia grimmiae]|uniref:hypothetical protein n=1 Tax=Caballeronia grimmiae TaxID=1071679 RepID=UPI0038B8C613